MLLRRNIYVFSGNHLVKVLICDIWKTSLSIEFRLEVVNIIGIELGYHHPDKKIDI
jgi:hypothetical protein